MGALEKQDLYRDLSSLPPSVRGEIINGQLRTQPRPAGKHILAASNIGAEYHGPYQKGRGGPGGWWILQEPEVHLELNEAVVVPDLAGWRKSRMPHIPDAHKFTVVPDWICEILSPSTASVDRHEKKPLYARYGVQYLWIVDPLAGSLETFKLNGDDWDSTGAFMGSEIVAVEPFADVAVSLSDLIGE